MNTHFGQRKKFSKENLSVRAGQMPTKPRASFQPVGGRAKRPLSTTACGLLLMAALGGALGVQAPSAHAGPAIGINIGGNVDYAGEMLFADAIKTSRPWGQPESPWDMSAPLDANGWPTTDAGVVTTVSSDVDLSGSYALSFNGQAADIHGAACSFSVQNKVYNPMTNTTTATVIVPRGQIQVNIAFIGTQRTASSALNTGITNVRLMRPISPGASTSFAPSVTFNTPIKNLVSKFGAIRFMDSTATNYNSIANWSNRCFPGYATQNQSGLSKGIAWEYVIQFANETGKDAWIDVPALATDDYIRKLAQLCKYGSDASGNPYTSAQTNPVYAPLASQLHLYVEYSNEVWNSSFDAWHQNYDAAYAAVHNNTPEGQILNTGLGAVDDSNRYIWNNRHVAKRAKEMSDLFRAVYGSAMLSQVRPVFEWQEGGGYVGDELPFLDDYYNNGDGQNHVASPHPPSYYFWGGGGSAYYSPDGNSDTLTLDQLFAQIAGGAGYAWETDSAWAYGYGLKHASYEGGPGLDTTGHSDSVKAQAVLDPRMKTAIINGQTAFDQNGGDLLMYYQAVGNYQWGFTNDPNNLSTYKLQGIDAINNAGKAPATAGVVLPATGSTSVNATVPHYAEGANGGYTDGQGNKYLYNLRSHLTFLLNVPQAGNYDISLLTSANDGSGQARVSVDGAPLGTLNIPNTGYNQGPWTGTAPVTVYLTAGLHGLRINPITNSSGWSLQAYNFKVNTANVPGTGNGLKGEYFTNQYLTDPVAVTRTDSTVNFDWGSNSPDVSVPNDHFSARWTGQVQATVSGNYTFSTNSDDGVRLWVNGTQVINDWSDHGTTADTSASIPLVAGQKYDIKMEYYESTGGAVAKLLWTPPGGNLQIIPQIQLYSPPVAVVPGTGNGLKGEYFANKSLTDPVTLTRTDSTVNFDWGNGSPDASLPVDLFSARWTGQVKATVSGNYTFSTHSDDGVRLWVNGTQVINDWNDHGITGDTSASIPLVAGQKYDIKMEYYEGGGGAVAKLLWTPPGGNLQIIPQTQLYSLPVSATSSAARVNSASPVATATPAPVPTVTPKKPVTPPSPSAPSS